jgi:CheY-like chemotaxis protein
MTSHILYVEDDAQSREIMDIMMKLMMPENLLTIFPNSINFIQRLEALSHSPSLFLLDIHVPPHDGFEMLTMIRQHPQFHSKIVIALTASVMNEEVENLKRAGFNGVIAKPLDMDTFFDTLKRIEQGEQVWYVIG